MRSWCILLREAHGNEEGAGHSLPIRHHEAHLAVRSWQQSTREPLTLALCILRDMPLWSVAQRQGTGAFIKSALHVSRRRVRLVCSPPPDTEASTRKRCREATSCSYWLRSVQVRCPLSSFPLASLCSADAALFTLAPGLRVICSTAQVVSHVSEGV